MCMCVCVCVCVCECVCVFSVSTTVAVHRKTMSIALNGACVKYIHIFRLSLGLSNSIIQFNKEAGCMCAGLSTKSKILCIMVII